MPSPQRWKTGRFQWFWVIWIIGAAVILGALLSVERTTAIIAAQGVPRSSLTQIPSNVTAYQRRLRQESQAEKAKPLEKGLDIRQDIRDRQDASCQKLIDSRIEVLKAEQGRQCWSTCRDELMLRVLHGDYGMMSRPVIHFMSGSGSFGQWLLSMMQWVEKVPLVNVCPILVVPLTLVFCFAIVGVLRYMIYQSLFRIMYCLSCICGGPGRDNNGTLRILRIMRSPNKFRSLIGCPTLPKTHGKWCYDLKVGPKHSVLGHREQGGDIFYNITLGWGDAEKQCLAKNEEKDLQNDAGDFPRKDYYYIKYSVFAGIEAVPGLYDKRIYPDLPLKWEENDIIRSTVNLDAEKPVFEFFHYKAGTRNSTKLASFEVNRKKPDQAFCPLINCENQEFELYMCEDTLPQKDLPPGYSALLSNAQAQAEGPFSLTALKKTTVGKKTKAWHLANGLAEKFESIISLLLLPLAVSFGINVVLALIAAELVQDLDALRILYPWIVPWVAAIKAARLPRLGCFSSLFIELCLLAPFVIRCVSALLSAIHLLDGSHQWEPWLPIIGKIGHDDDEDEEGQLQPPSILQTRQLYRDMRIPSFSKGLGNSAFRIVGLFFGFASVFGTVSVFDIGGHMLFLCGAHGVEWICAKSASASVFSGVPGSDSGLGAYTLGLLYALCSLFHGFIILGAKRVEEIQFTEPSSIGQGLFPSDAFMSIAYLRRKFVTLFCDVILDMAQIFTFFINGQPFFAGMNFVGILQQMVLFLFAMVKSSVEEESFLTIVLQSDAAKHYTSSLPTKLAIREFYEKAYREAFGETYISLFVSIAALLMVKVESYAALAIFVLNFGSSMLTVGEGIAEANELYNAEAGTLKRHIDFQSGLIPENHYYFRRDLKAIRNLKGFMSQVNIFRLAEAPLAAATVCLFAVSSGSIKITFVYGILLSSIINFPEFELPPKVNASRNLGPKWWVNLVIRSVLEIVYTSCFRFKRILFLFESTIAVPGYSKNRDEFKDADMVSFFVTKCIFIGVMWLLLLVSLIAPIPLCPGSGVVLDFREWISTRITAAAAMPSITEMLHGNFPTPKTIRAALHLMAGPVTLIAFAYVLLTFRALADKSRKWRIQDATNAWALKKDCGHIAGVVQHCIKDLMAHSIIHPYAFTDWFLSDLGYLESYKQDEETTSVLAEMIFLSVYGSWWRPERPRNPEDPRWDQTESWLRRELYPIDKTRRAMSPMQLAEDIRLVISKIPFTYRSPEMETFCEQLDNCATWLEGLTIVDVDRKKVGNNGYTTMQTAAELLQGVPDAELQLSRRSPHYSKEYSAFVSGAMGDLKRSRFAENNRFGLSILEKLSNKPGEVYEWSEFENLGNMKIYIWVHNDEALYVFNIPEYDRSFDWVNEVRHIQRGLTFDKGTWSHKVPNKLRDYSGQGKVAWYESFELESVDPENKAKSVTWIIAGRRHNRSFRTFDRLTWKTVNIKEIESKFIRQVLNEEIEVRTSAMESQDPRELERTLPLDTEVRTSQDFVQRILVAHLRILQAEAAAAAQAVTFALGNKPSTKIDSKFDLTRTDLLMDGLLKTFGVLKDPLPVGELRTLIANLKSVLVGFVDQAYDNNGQLKTDPLMKLNVSCTERIQDMIKYLSLQLYKAERGSPSDSVKRKNPDVGDEVAIVNAFPMQKPPGCAGVEGHWALPTGEYMAEIRDNKFMIQGDDDYALALMRYSEQDVGLQWKFGDKDPLLKLEDVTRHIKSTEQFSIKFKYDATDNYEPVSHLNARLINEGGHERLEWKGKPEWEGQPWIRTAPLHYDDFYPGMRVRFPRDPLFTSQDWRVAMQVANNEFTVETVSAKAGAGLSLAGGGASMFWRPWEHSQDLRCPQLSLPPVGIVVRKLGSSAYLVANTQGRGVTKVKASELS